MFRWFGHEPKLKFLPFDEWKTTQEPDDAQATFEHIGRSPAHSIEKGRRLIGYEPRYSSLAAVKESVGWLRDNGRI
jgi:nucleoside-diphosphate-sugar epimerase